MLDHAQHAAGLERVKEGPEHFPVIARFHRPVMHITERENQVERSGRREGGMFRCPNRSDDNLAVELGIFRKLFLESQARFAVGIGGLFIDGEMRSVEEALVAQVGREDLRIPACARPYFGDMRIGTSAQAIS